MAPSDSTCSNLRGQSQPPGAFPVHKRESAAPQMLDDDPRVPAATQSIPLGPASSTAGLVAPMHGIEAPPLISASVSLSHD